MALSMFINLRHRVAWPRHWQREIQNGRDWNVNKDYWHSAKLSEGGMYKGVVRERIAVCV